jgi:hypothetical protein
MPAKPAASAGATDASGARPLSQATLVALAAYFVTIWGAGFVATRIALQYAAPFTYIGVRYAIAFVLALLAFGLRARWPANRHEWRHAAVAGLLSHAGYLGGSHYAQRLGLSAGVTALILALQPLLTALIVSAWLHEGWEGSRSSASSSAWPGSRWSSAIASTPARCRQRAWSRSSSRSPASPPGRCTSASSAPTSICARRCASISPPPRR